MEYARITQFGAAQNLWYICPCKGTSLARTLGCRCHSWRSRGVCLMSHSLCVVADFVGVLGTRGGTIDVPYRFPSHVRATVHEFQLTLNRKARIKCVPAPGLRYKLRTLCSYHSARLYAFALHTSIVSSTCSSTQRITCVFFQMK